MAGDGFPGNALVELHLKRDEYEFTMRQRDWHAHYWFESDTDPVV